MSCQLHNFFFMRSEHGPRKHNFRRPSTKWATETKNRGPSELPITQFFFMRSEHGPRKHSFRRPITIWATKTKIVPQVSFAQRLRGAKCRGPSTKWATKTKNRGPNYRMGDEIFVAQLFYFDAQTRT